VTNNDDAYRTALALHRAGLIVPVIVDARPPRGRPRRAGPRRRPPHRGGPRHRQGQGPPPRDRRDPLRARGRGRGHRGHRLRRRRHVGRLDPLGPSLVPRRRRARLGRRPRDVPPDPQSRRVTTTAPPW
jgi:hypothetical protein